MKVVFALIAALAAATAPALKYHFHDGENTLGNVLGVSLLDDQFHLLFVTPLEGADDPIMGAIGHATSPDLVHWQREHPVLQPDDGCFIDGGSVVISGSSLVAYFGHRCCAALNCATEIRRATTTDGFYWTQDDDPVLSFESAPFLTLPSVAYDAGESRWVMTLSGAQDSDGYQPTFYQSSDGTIWTEGGIFVPPTVSGGDEAHFEVFTNNFLMPMDDKWVLMGTRSDGLPVFFIGTLDATTGIFSGDHGIDGHEMFWDFGESPFPVWGHPSHDHVIMNVIRGVAGSTQKVLSLPLSVAPATGSSLIYDVEEYLQADWIQAVKDLIVPSTGDPNDEYTGTSLTLEPSDISADGLYSFTGLLTITFEGPVMLRFEDTDSNSDVYAPLVALSGTDETVVAHLQGESQSAYVPNFDQAVPLDVAVLLDRGIAEVRIGQWVTRGRFGNELVSDLISLAGSAFTVAGGWTLDPVTAAPVLEPTEEPTTTSTTEEPTTTS
eukprot:Polyplicarium_translucidae@DN3302_c0_g2_i1.p1